MPYLMLMRRFATALVSCLLLTALTVRAAHTQVQLLLSADTAKPGDTIWAGVDLKMETGWHTYWKNPGDAGMATEIKWQLPPGISAGEIQWPLPEKFPPIEVTTYGYENEVMLLVPLKIETNFSSGQIDLKANVSWLECKEVCIPANAVIQATLNIGNEKQTWWIFSQMLPTNLKCKLRPKNFQSASFRARKKLECENW